MTTIRQIAMLRGIAKHAVQQPSAPTPEQPSNFNYSRMFGWGVPAYILARILGANAVGGLLTAGITGALGGKQILPGYRQVSDQVGWDPLKDARNWWDNNRAKTVDANAETLEATFPTAPKK